MYYVMANGTIAMYRKGASDTEDAVLADTDK